MNTLKRLAKFSRIVSKRLFVRPGFLILILLIPLLVVGMQILSEKESGVVSVALAAEDTGDPIAAEIIGRLTDNDPIIRFTVYDTPTQAINAVASAKADAAWIFPENTADRIAAFALDPGAANYVVDIVQREENIVLRIANERLSGALYSYCSKATYINTLRSRFPELSELSDGELMEYYESTWAEGDVFQFGHVDESSKGIEKVSYLTAPIRGLLYVLCAMGGLAAALFYQKDELSGLTERISKKERFAFEYICHFLPVLYMAFAGAASLYIAGIGISILRELAIALIYAAACAPMCMLLRRIFARPERLAVVSPLFVILLTVICPVFINTNVTRPIQMLLAPYYALTAVHNIKYVGFMAFYAVLLTAVNFLLFKRKIKR